MKSKRYISSCIVVAILFGPFIGIQTPISQIKTSYHNDLSGAKVAVYDGGAGVSSDPRGSSAAALYWMFRWMNATVQMVNSSEIKHGIINDFQIIAVPGGYAYDYYLDLGQTGADAIREFVEEGGAYWGSCAGAYYACEEFEWSEYGRTGVYHYGLGLFSGCGVGPIAGIADWPEFAMTDIEINTTNELVNFSQESNTHSIMYYGGPYFETDGMESITILATYEYNDMPAMIAFEYLDGRVFLTGPHPEWEEDSYRDGCVWDNNLDDNGSEWQLCKEIALWLASIDDVSSDSAPDFSLIIPSISISVIAAVFLIYGLRRKQNNEVMKSNER